MTCDRIDTSRTMITAVPPGIHGRHGDRAVLDRIVVDVIHAARAALVISDALRPTPDSAARTASYIAARHRLHVPVRV